MRQTMKVLSAVSVTFLAGFAAMSHAAGDKKLVQNAASELKWEEFFPGGPQEAFTVGSKESKKGPTAFFIKFKSGFDSGWHTHESAYTGVVLSGTIIETSKGGEGGKQLSAGSSYMQPAVVHKTVCAEGSDCLEYIYEDGAFSFTPTDENGKPVPMPAAMKK